MTILARLTATVWLYPTALLLGFVHALAFDIPFDSRFAWLAPMLSFSSLLGFLYFLQFLSAKRGGLFGYCYGLGFLGWGLNWVYISMANYGNAPFLFAVLANIGVIAYLSLYWFVAAFVVAFIAKTANQRLLLTAAVVAFLEWVRSFFLIGFPWLSVGYAWIDSPLAKLATAGGVFLLTFVAVMLAAICLLKIRRFYKLLLLTFLVGLPAVLSIKLPHSTPTKKLNVALVQGNMPVITEYNEERMTENLVQYHLLTDELLQHKTHDIGEIDVVVWPESAIPYFYDEVPTFLQDIHAEQQKHHFDLISGAPHGSWESKRIYNAIFLQSEQNNRPTFYYKQHLLPFGEYLPFRKVFAFFEDFVDIPMSDFARGNVVQQPFVSNGVSFAPSICFEAVFGDEIRQNAINANVLLNISNDAWFGKSKAQAQHLNIARMRAVENAKYLIRATNNGITAVVTPSGNVVQSIPPFAAGVLTATVTAHSSPTLYARFGDMPWVIVFVGFGLCVMFYSQKPIKSKDNKTKSNTSA